jgi:putative PIN family toxin of toxin-antitoxin system
MKNRVIFDTNILISAVLSPNGKPFQCTALAKQNLITSLTCREILQEFEEKLVNKLRFELEVVQKIINEILAYSELITLTNIPRVIIDDPDDDIIIAVAVSGKANYILSGDKHLLNLKQHQDITIVTASEFLSNFFEFKGISNE